MFILDLTYTAPLSEADLHMEGHMQWVDMGYERLLFLASGRKVPRTGGVILAQGERDDIEAYCALDPFVTHGIARYHITEMMVTRATEGLELLKG